MIWSWLFFEKTISRRSLKAECMCDPPKDFSCHSRPDCPAIGHTIQRVKQRKQVIGKGQTIGMIASMRMKEYKRLIGVTRRRKKITRRISAEHLNNYRFDGSGVARFSISGMEPWQAQNHQKIVLQQIKLVIFIPHAILIDSSDVRLTSASLFVFLLGFPSNPYY
jgi:hypothetical protein